MGQAKCGTDSLYREIASHPQFAPLKWALYREKEVHFFNKFWIDRGPRWYADKVIPDIEIGDNLFSGEASPPYGYLPGLDVVRRMKKVIPETKIIVVTRDPIQRIESWARYQNIRRIRHETVVKWTRQLDPCLRSQDSPPRFDFGCMERLWSSVGKWPSGMCILTGSLYSQLLQRIYTEYPREQVMVVQFEDLYRGKIHDETMENVFKFLGARIHRSKMESLNINRKRSYRVWRNPKRTKSFLRKWLSRFRAYGLEELSGQKIKWLN